MECIDFGLTIYGTTGLSWSQEETEPGEEENEDIQPYQTREAFGGIIERKTRKHVVNAVKNLITRMNRKKNPAVRTYLLKRVVIDTNTISANFFYRSNTWICVSVSKMDDEYTEPEKKPSRRGFAKIDVVDVILSVDPKTLDKPTTAFEQLAESTISKSLVYAPTYRLEPKRKFDSDVVRKILVECLEKDSKEMSYSEKECQNACKRISYYIRRAVKQLSYDRYRIICQVRIMEKQNQGIEARTGFLWDPDFDGFVSHTINTQSYVAQAVVFGVYKS